jgi:ABC-2 type transport system ATP-binding protein
MIEVTNLRKSYGKLLAVDGVTLNIPDGETMGLLGPNGAGKTTMLHMLTGALAPDSGTITIAGHQDPRRPSVRKQIGLATQTISLYDSLTAEENLHFFGRLYGLGGTNLRRRVQHCLDLAGLVDRCQHRVKTYSGGMKRRLNLACAMVHDPAVLLMDEPTVGVDPQSRNHLFQTIKKLAADGRTIIYTTHYMEEAQRLCDRVAIVDHGRVLAVNTVSALIAEHGGQTWIEAELAEMPPSFDALPAKPVGNKLYYRADRPFEEASRLTNLGLKLSAFRIIQPDLEKVFLKLTGHGLRD